MGARTATLTGAENLPGARNRWLEAGVCAGVLLLAALLVFVLPLHVPVRPVHGISTSYLAGFNNTVATAGAGLLSLLVLAGTAWTWRGRAVPQIAERRQGQLGWGWIVPVVVLSGCVLGGWWHLVLESHERYLGDAGYMVEQASVWRDTGRALYSQVEFGYGPLLVLPAAWFGELLHTSTAVGYGIALVLESTLGLLVLAYVLNVLPIRVGVRRAAFLVLAVGAITPHLGMNYTYLRFLSPLAVLLFATRSPVAWRSAVLLAAGLVLEMLLSPELGFATLAGALVFAAIRVRQSGWVWSLAGMVPVVAAILLLLLLGSPYLALLHTFTQGGFNLPVGPYPHILVFLLAMVWLAPLAVGQRVRWDDAESGRLLAVYLAALALSAAALGRCDPLHVLFNGAGIFVLSLMAVSGSAAWLRAGWIACLMFLVFWDNRVNNALFQYRTAYTVKETLLPYVPGPVRSALEWAIAAGNPDVQAYFRKPEEAEYTLPMTQFEQLTGGAPVVTPSEISPTLEAQLKSTHQYSPGYYAFWVNIMFQTAEERETRFVNQFQWMLLPTHFEGTDPQLPKEVGKFQGIPSKFRQREPVLYTSGEVLESAVEQRWQPVETFGEYTLYHQTAPAAPGASN